MVYTIDAFNLQKLCLVSSISNVEQRIADAKEFIAMSKGASDSIKDSLLGCAVIMLASAVEQGTRSCIIYHSKLMAHHTLVIEKHTRFYPYLKATLRHRMQILPELCSNFTLKLNRFNKHVKCLFEMIPLRNKLVHCEDTIRVGRLADIDDVQLLDSGENYITLRLPLNCPWTKISPEIAKDCLLAVTKYYEEVVLPCYEFDIDNIYECIAEELKKSDLISC